MTDSRIGSVLLYYNPISGKGRGERASNALQAILREEGYNVETLCAQTDENYDFLHDQLSQVDAVIVLGGDGTLMKLLPALQLSLTPVYKVPLGVESLFSREFGMRQAPEAILAALKNRHIVERFPAKVGTVLFFTMVSLGIDSEVVAKISTSRSSPIGRTGYLIPTLRTLLSHRPPVVSLTVDRRKVLSEASGFLVIANTKHYALGIGYTPEAGSENDSLCARFFPYTNLLTFFRQSIEALLFPRKRSADLPFFSGKSFLVETSTPYAIQADGEHLGSSPVELSVSSQKIRILLPETTPTDRPMSLDH